MIEQKDHNNQLPKEIKSVFTELNISKHLRQAGIKKSFGFTCNYLFQLVFCLIFHHKNWFRILESKKSDQLPAKDEHEIVKIYGMRWDIEVFFKTTKSLLRLQKEFQGRSYDLLISHTTIVFARYIVLSWQNRCNTDQ